MNKVLPLATASETDDPDIVMLDADSVDWDDPEIDPEFKAAVAEGFADIEAGRFVDLEDVERWVNSWGNENELPMPVCNPKAF